MLVPYFLKPVRLADEYPEWGDADITQEDIERALLNYRGLQKQSKPIPKQLQSFIDGMNAALMDGEYKKPRNKKRTDAADGEEALTLGLHVWYLYEFDPVISNLSKTTDRKASDHSPIWEAIHARLVSEWQPLISPHDLTSYIGSIENLKNKKRVAEKKALHRSSSLAADRANLQSLGYLCRWVGIPEDQEQLAACQMLILWKRQSGLSGADGAVYIDEEAIAQVYAGEV